MAVEVISTKHPSATKTVVCRNCGAELLYTNSDIREEIGSDYTGGKDTYRLIDCPECSYAIIVS